MNEDTLKELWISPENLPAQTAAGTVAGQFLHRMRSRRRWQTIWLLWTVLALTTTTIAAIVQTVTKNDISFSDRGMFWPMLVAPWVLTFWLIRNYLRNGRAPAHAALSLVDTLVVVETSLSAERRRLISIGLLLVIMFPITAFAVRQLVLEGKASTQEAWSMIQLFALIFGLCSVGLIVRYRWWILPEKRKLEALREDLATGSTE